MDKLNRQLIDIPTLKPQKKQIAVYDAISRHQHENYLSKKQNKTRLVKTPSL